MAFRGSLAVASGLVTWDVLRGPRYVRQFPDVYVARTDEQARLDLRSHAAYRLVEGRGVLSGYSAAEVLGVSCAAEGAPAEVTVPGGGQRAHPGLLVRRNELAPGEIRQIGSLRTTTALRTAFDLALQPDLTEAVVAVDALADKGRFSPDLLLHFAVHCPRTRNKSRLATVLAHASPYAGSPMESRLRMLLVLAGLPRPRVQWMVQDEHARTAIWLDLAYPEQRVGIEYEGGDHVTPEVVLRDAGRYTRLVDRGWRIYRYPKYDVYGEPERIVGEVARALQRLR
ncbi:endonuclease domain-containing protein [Pseudonocardia sp. GCM10023141]|uniref:endonuclease domain-containing protein n=1 Tax=Pseudonocardia sp. GCM10023141 TaxID=3252653 RepID=UPI00360F6BFC